MKMKNRVLAVLALALLMINMAPVRVAEAAANETYTVPWGPGEKTFTLDEYQYYMYFVCSDSSRTSYYLALCENVLSVKNDSDSFLSCSEGSGVLYTYNDFVNPATADNELTSNISPRMLTAVLKINGGVFCNFDVTNYYNREQILYSTNPLYVPEPEPLVLPVTEPGYEYWLYHRTTSGEYMYWSKDPFDLEVSEGKYILNLSTGDIVYRLHMNPSHTYYRQILSGSMQYVISPGDIFRSGQELVFDGVTINAWMEGDVTSEEVQAPQYDIPHITKFLDRVRSARTPLKEVIEGGLIKDPEYIYGPREYSMSINLELSGDFDAAVTEQKILIDGNYILPSEDYFVFCETKDIEPDTTHFMGLVKSKQEKYYYYVDWSHIGSIVDLPGSTSDYGFRLIYSAAVDALIGRGEFDVLYSDQVQAAYDDDIRRLCCPYRLACTLIGVVDEEYYYGDTYITVLYSELDKATEDVSGVYSDYVSLDNDQRTDAIESTINAAQDDKLRDYIDKKDAEIDALIEEYEMKLATLDATITSSGSGDLFRTFSSLANGLSGLSGSFRGIATAVGNVFAFFPEEITMILYAGFVACIVIAVYKALRG